MFSRKNILRWVTVALTLPSLRMPVQSTSRLRCTRVYATRNVGKNGLAAEAATGSFLRFKSATSSIVEDAVAKKEAQVVSSP